MVRGFLAGVLLAWLLVTDALAGAWPQPEGQGQVIFTTSRKIAPVGALLGDLAESDTNATSVFVEYGLTQDLTLGLTAYGDYSSTDLTDYEARVGGHVRYRFWTGEDGDVLSAQAAVGLPVERWLGNGLGDDRPESVPELRLGALYGRGWQTGWGNSFISTELGILIRGEQKAEELRFDFTAGHEPLRGFLGLISVFAAQPMGGPSATSLKLSPSIAYTVWPWVGENEKKPEGPFNPNTLQLGVTWDAANPDDGLEIFLSVWKSF